MRLEIGASHIPSLEREWGGGGGRGGGSGEGKRGRQRARERERERETSTKGGRPPPTPPTTTTTTTTTTTASSNSNDVAYHLARPFFFWCVFGLVVGSVGGSWKGVSGWELVVGLGMGGSVYIDSVYIDICMLCVYISTCRSRDR